MINSDEVDFSECCCKEGPTMLLVFFLTFGTYDKLAKSLFTFMIIFLNNWSQLKSVIPCFDFILLLTEKITLPRNVERQTWPCNGIEWCTYIIIPNSCVTLQEFRVKPTELETIPWLSLMSTRSVTWPALLTNQMSGSAEYVKSSWDLVQDYIRAHTWVSWLIIVLWWQLNLYELYTTFTSDSFCP